ncbi:FecR domain-containing protein [Rhizobacter sp. Root1221]|uniref:FecR domain-containing protein n=1 Tax=Rhizobacter sp. Root1221 TaxID=1736433 RepID=UPI00070029FD|nr:FecR domain-containing protein [Rhizobacter sp. Root1221]KQW01314.1 hypothetical protein ASC87_15655 [Rhizobacter sp. Root1221]
MKVRSTGWLAGIALAVATLGWGAPAAGQAPAAAEWHYRIARGDTLIGLGHTYLVDPRQWVGLQRLNRITNPYRLVPGSVLRIPMAWVSQRATLAEAAFVKGTATVQHGPAGAAEPLVAGVTLRAGDVLRTGSDGSATVRFADGTRLIVVPDSAIALTHLLAMGKPGIPDISMRLLEGTSELRVPPTSAPTRRVEVRTPAVNLGVRGTEFRAGFDPAEQRSRLEVLDGRVAAEGAGRTVPVDAGLGVVVAAGQSVGAPQALPEVPDLASAPARVERVPLRVAWPAVPGAAAYRAQVFAQGAPDSLLLGGVFVAPEARWADLPDGAYVMHVRVRAAGGLEGRDALHPFVLKARPEPPFTLRPVPAARSYGDAAALEWARVGVAERYRVQVSARPDFAHPLLDRDDVDTARLAVPLPPGTYHWRVASVAAGGDRGPFGDALSFEQRPVPASPALEAPQAGPGGLVFRWKAPDPGQTVHYQVATDAAFTQLVADERASTNEGRIPAPAPGTYHLRARTIDTGGFEGPFGAAQQVDVPRSPWWMLVPALTALFLL